MENEKKRIKLALIPLFFSSFFLIFGTYAWFTYFSDIDSTMTGHVVGWNIDFDGDTNIESEYSVIINDVYRVNHNVMLNLQDIRKTAGM